MSTTADNQNRLTQAIADYMRRVDAGELVDRDQFLEANPRVTAELQRYLDNVALIERMAGPTPAEQSESATGDGARRETVSASQGGDSVPEKKATGDSGPITGKFGRYHIEKTLGEGAMGTVFLARDTQLDRRVALKVPKFKDDDTEMMERFYREARSAAKLRHRHICPVHDIGTIDGIKYISIGYIDGHPLSAFVSEDKPQTERNVAIIIRKLALALDVAHREGVIHRDLKPANVMVDKKTEPVIMDFGLARQMNTQENERLTQTGTIMGSPAYMSPEQVNADNDKIGPCSDIYSLGVMLYELLTGKLPFEGSIAAVIGQILMKEPDKPSTFRAGLDPRIEEICAKMMAKEIDERYASMKDVADALTSFLKNPTTTGAKRSVGKLESFAPVELKEVTRKSKKGRRTVAPKQAALQPAETFATSNQASGGRQPADASMLQTSFERLKNLPRWAMGVAATCGALVILWAITLIFKSGDQTIEIVIDDPNATVTVDGDAVEIVSQGQGGFGTFTGKLGEFGYEWKVERNGETLSGTGSFTLKKGMQTPIRIVTHRTQPPDPPSGGEPRNPPYEPVVELHRFDDAESVKGVPDAVAFWPDGNSIVDTFGPEKKLRRRDVLTGEVIDYEFAGEIAAGVECLAFSADGNLLAVGKSDGRILIWDLRANQMKKVFNATNMPIRSVSFSRNDARLLGYAAKAPSNALILGWDILEDQAIKSISVRCYNLGFGRSIAFSPDGTQVAAARISGFKDGLVELWNIADSKQPVRSFDSNMSATRKSVHGAIFLSVRFSLDGKHLIASSDGGSSHRDGFVHVWDAASGREILSCLQKQTVSAVAITPDSRWIVSSDFLPGGKTTKALGTLTVWDAQTGNKSHSWPLPAIDAKAELRVKRIEFSPDGKRFFTAGQNTPTTVWELNPSTGAPAVRLANAPPERLDDLATGTWVPVFTAASDTKTIDNTAATWTDGVLELVGEDDESKFAQVESIAGPRGRNVILRAEVNLLAGHHAAIGLRSPDTSADFDYINTHISGNACSLWRSHSQSRKGGGFHVDLPPIDNTQGFRDLAIALVDGHIAAYVDGRRVAERSDWSEARNFSPELHVFSFNKKEKTRAQFRNVRMMVLNDKPSELPTGQWVRLLENKEQLQEWQATDLEPTFNEGTIGLAREKPAAPNESRSGRLTRMFDTTARRFIIHVRHKKVAGFMAGESVGIGSHGFEVAHFGPEKHELWTSLVNGKRRTKKIGVFESTAGSGEFADCDYVVIDGEFTAYLNGQKMYSHTASAAPLTSISLGVRAFNDDSTVRAEWRDIAVMRLSGEQVAAIRAGELPKYVPADKTPPDDANSSAGPRPGIPHAQLAAVGWGDLANSPPTRSKDFDDESSPPGAGDPPKRGNAAGRFFIEGGSGWVAWNKLALTAGVVEVSGRVASGKAAWVINLANQKIRHGFHIIARHDGGIEYGDTLFLHGNKPLLESGTLVQPNPTFNASEFHTIGIVVQLRSVRVFLDGEPIGREITTGYDLAPGVIALGRRGAGRVEFDRVNQWEPSKRVVSPDAEEQAGPPLPTGQPGLVKKLPAHKNVVVSVAFSPDGKTVASASPKEHAVPLFDVATGREVARLVAAGGGENASRVLFAPDGKTLAVGYGDGSVRLWDLATNQVVREFLGHEGKIYALDFSPNGHFLVSAGWDTTARVWDVPIGRQVTLFDKHPRREKKKYQPIFSAVFAADGTQVISKGGTGQGALRWEAETGKVLNDFDGKSPGNVYLKPDGQPMFMDYSGTKNQVELNSAIDGTTFARLQGHTAVVTGFDYLPDGKHVVTGSRDGTLRVWNIETEQEVHRYTSNTHTTNVLDVSPDGRYVVSAGGAIQSQSREGDLSMGLFESTGDYSLYLWRLPELTGEPKQNVPAPKQPTIGESLNTTISVNFKRTSLQGAFKEIGKQAGVEIRIDVNGLKSKRYTTNMRQKLTLKNKPASDVIDSIVEKYDEMVWRIEKDHVLITVAKKKWQLPQVNFKEIKDLAAAELKKGTFGRPPRVNIKAMDQFVRDEVARRKADGRMSPTGLLEIKFGSDGVYASGSVKDAPNTTRKRRRGVGGGGGLGGGSLGGGSLPQK